jgi:hypothetical protein
MFFTFVAGKVSILALAQKKTNLLIAKPPPRRKSQGSHPPGWLHQFSKLRKSDSHMAKSFSVTAKL